MLSNSDSDNSLWEKPNNNAESPSEKLSRSSTTSQSNPASSQPGPKQDLINNVFTWITPKNEKPAKEVLLTGQFADFFRGRIPMKQNGNEFTAVVPLERGLHQYKFIVDGVWRYSEDQPKCHDGNGNTNNIVDTTH